MKKHIFGLLSAMAGFVLFLLVSPALGQEQKEPKIKFNLFSVKNYVSGKRIKIDQAYGQKYNIAVPAPFSVIVPIDKKKFRSLVAPAPKPGSAFVKFNFATFDQPPKLRENIQFVSMRLPMVETDERLRIAMKLLRNQGFSAAVRGKQEPNILGSRYIKIGKLGAAEVFGRYVEASLGVMYVRLVAIPNPDKINSIFSIANVVARYISLKGPDDFVSKTQGGKSLTTFRYLR